MARIKKSFAINVCAAAVGCAFSFGASAQAVTTFQTGIQSGLDRAVKNPLEIIWLQSEVQEDMWRSPALAHALQGCGKLGTPKEGCGVSVRSAMRYSFDANSAVRTAPIVISSLSIPNAPFTAGRLNLSGSGRVYLITSQAPASPAVRPPAGAVLLAAGSTVHLVDAYFPSIQIEVKAPDDQPLFLGNLAESDVTKVVAMLVKQPGIVSASAVEYTRTGQVALRAAPTGFQNIQLASATSTLPATVARAEPIALDLTGLAGRIEVREAEKRALPASSFKVASIDATFAARMPELAAVVPMDYSALAGTLRLPAKEIARPGKVDFQNQALTRLPAPVEVAIAVASVDLSGLAGKLHLPIREVARSAPVEVLNQDLARLPVPVEVAIAAAPIDLSSLAAGKLDLSSARASAQPAAVALTSQNPGVLVSVMERIATQTAAPQVAQAKIQAPIQLAMAAPAVAASGDIAKMRAEIEAEIARERDRLAQSLQGRASRTFRFGT